MLKRMIVMLAATMVIVAALAVVPAVAALAMLGALIGNSLTAPRYHGRCARWGWNGYGHRVCRAWY